MPPLMQNGLWIKKKKNDDETVTTNTIVRSAGSVLQRIFFYYCGYSYESNWNEWIDLPFTSMDFLVVFGELCFCDVTV